MNYSRHSDRQDRNVLRTEEVEKTLLEVILDLGSIMNLSEVDEP